MAEFNEGQQTHTLTIDALGVDREFPPSDTQEFSLPLKKAGEFKVYCRFHPGPGDDGGSKRRVMSRSAFGRVNGVEEQDVIVH